MVDYPGILTRCRADDSRRLALLLSQMGYEGHWLSQKQLESGTPLITGHTF